MVISAACPQDENPLSYARLTGEWAIWSEIAHRFERKVPTQDRGDIRHTIILELAQARARDGNKPFSEALMCRIASFVVADYWRKEKRKPTILSLDTERDNGDEDGDDRPESTFHRYSQKSVRRTGGRPAARAGCVVRVLSDEKRRRTLLRLDDDDVHPPVVRPALRRVV